MNGIIKVSPQVLINTASDFSERSSAVSSLTGEMMNLITGMASAWEGEAATTYISRFRGLEDDIQRLVRMIQEHSTDLETMARTYIQADDTNAQEASSLSSDVIA